MRIALLLLTLTVCWTNAQSTIANGTLSNAVLGQPSSLVSGLVSYWKLDEAGTGTRYDSYGGNDLTAVNSPGYTTGKITNAVTLDGGSSQYLQVQSSDALSFSITNSFTISLWMNQTNNGVNQVVLSKTTSNRIGYWMVFYAGGRMSLEFKTATGANLYTIGSSAILGSYKHFVATYSGSFSTNGILLFVNGTKESSLETGLSGSGGDILNSSVFTLGRFSLGENYANGAVDECGVWNRVLSDAEISYLYKSGTGCTYPSFSRRSQPLDFNWDNWQPLQLPEQIPVAFVNRKPELLSLCE